MIIVKYEIECRILAGKGYCLMEQKIDNIYRSYKDNDNIDNVLFDIYEIILAKLDSESFEEV